MPPKKPAQFDPFAEQRLSTGSKSWLWATALQALCTLGLIGFEKWSCGQPWEQSARLITAFGIIGTWSLALRTIRERLVELIRVWQKASQGLLRKASESGRHLISARLSPDQEKYIKGAIWRLRIIAAGISIPFFVMPLVWSVLSLVLTVHGAVELQRYWAGVAVTMVLTSIISIGYLHWSLVPLPVPVRVSGARRRPVE